MVIIYYLGNKLVIIKFKSNNEKSKKNKNNYITTNNLFSFIYSVIVPIIGIQWHFVNILNKLKLFSFNFPIYHFADKSTCDSLLSIAIREDSI